MYPPCYASLSSGTVPSHCPVVMLMVRRLDHEPRLRCGAGSDRIRIRNQSRRLCGIVLLFWILACRAAGAGGGRLTLLQQDTRVLLLLVLTTLHSSIYLKRSTRRWRMG